MRPVPEDEAIRCAVVAHEVNRAYCKSVGDDSQPSWDAAPNWQRESAIEGARSVLRGDILTAEQSHQQWMTAKLQKGWIFGTEKDAEARTHPCLVPYDELSQQQRTKDELFIATVKATHRALTEDVL